AIPLGAWLFKKRAEVCRCSCVTLAVFFRGHVDRWTCTRDCEFARLVGCNVARRAFSLWKPIPPCCPDCGRRQPSANCLRLAPLRRGFFFPPVPYHYPCSLAQRDLWLWPSSGGPPHPAYSPDQPRMASQKIIFHPRREGPLSGTVSFEANFGSVSSPSSM